MAAKTIRAPFPPGALKHSLLTLENKTAMAEWHYWSRSMANVPHLIWTQTDILSSLQLI